MARKMTTTFLGLTAIALVLLGVTPTAAAHTFKVGPGGTHTTVQGAVDSSMSYIGTNEIRVATGTFVGRVFVGTGFNTGELEISGGWDPTFTIQSKDASLTILDGERGGSTVKIVAKGGIITLRNLTITGGYNNIGGGVWVNTNKATIKLFDCRVVGNEILDETTGADGGGVNLQLNGTGAAQIVRTVISGNTAKATKNSAFGGGINATATDTAQILLEDSWITGNTAISTVDQVNGAGLSMEISSQAVATVRRCVVARNTGTPKTGVTMIGNILIASDTARIDCSHSAFLDSSGGSDPINSHNLSLSPSGSGTVTLTNSIVAGSYGQGLSMNSSTTQTVRVTNCTLTGHPVSDLRGEATSVYNTIVRTVYSGSPLVLGSSGCNLIGVDPLFVNAALHDYRLSPGSPAINVGVSSVPDGLSVTDFAGQTRVLGSKVDIGAHEYSVVTQRAAALAHSTGVGKTSWRSDLDVTNAGARPVDLTLRFHTTEGETTRHTLLTPGDTRRWNDAAVSLFGAQEASSVSGTLGIEDPSGAVVAALRTYADLGEAGTYGQGYPTLGEGAGLVFGKVGFVPIVKSNAKFYSNIGIQNLGTVTAEARVTLVGPNGAQLGNPLTVVANPNCWAQLNDVFAKASVASAEVAYARIEPVIPGVRVWGGASVVDRFTKDPTTVEAIEPVTAGTVLRVPSVAHSSGYGGTPWRSTVAIVNTENESGKAILTFRGGSIVVKTVQLGARSVLEWGDVLVEFFGVDAGATASGTLEIVSNRQVVVACRTYADRSTAGTYGQSYPALTTDRGLMKGTAGVLSQLRKNNLRYTNIGVQNLSGVPCNGSAQLHDAQGKEIGSVLHFSPQPGGWSQISDAFLAASAGGANAASATVKVDTEGCALWFYASVVDNSTRDPTTIELARPLIVEPKHSAVGATAAPIE